MPKILRISLTAEQSSEVEQARDHSDKPYMRERACAILKIASGMSGRQACLPRSAWRRQVAQQGLLKKRRKDTIYLSACVPPHAQAGEWVNRYQAEGISGLQIRSGRGRKPAFSP